MGRPGGSVLVPRISTPSTQMVVLFYRCSLATELRRAAGPRRPTGLKRIPKPHALLRPPSVAIDTVCLGIEVLEDLGVFFRKGCLVQVAVDFG